MEKSAAMREAAKVPDPLTSLSAKAQDGHYPLGIHLQDTRFDNCNLIRTVRTLNAVEEFIHADVFAPVILGSLGSKSRLDAFGSRHVPCDEFEIETCKGPDVVCPRDSIP